jgi:hypothetical protein
MSRYFYGELRTETASDECKDQGTGSRFRVPDDELKIVMRGANKEDKVAA